MRLMLLLLAAGLLLAAPADARMHAPYRGHRIVAGGTPPLDTFATPSAAYSFRKLKSTYAGPAIRIRRASDNAELDIGFLGFVSGLGSPIDYVAANAHCAATTCFLKTWYDQSGAARDATQVTPANQPPLTFNCIGTLPCMSSTDYRFLAYAGVTVTVTSTFSAVMKRTGAAGACQVATNTPNAFMFTLDASANTWRLEATGGFNATAADGAWHAAVGVINGASSVLRIDGTETTGTVTGAAGGGAIFQVYQLSAGGCAHTEAVVWGNYALTPAERTALTQNQRSFWGTP